MKHDKGSPPKHRKSSATQRLASLAARLSPLIQEVPRLREPLDLTLGAVWALVLANKLGYMNRRWHLSTPYYNGKVSGLAKEVGKGKGLADRLWLAGFHFNSALLRIAAVYEAVLRLYTGKRHANVPALIECLECIERASRAFQHTNLDKVRKEVNRIKHDPEGVGPGRRVTLDEAVAALRELIDFIEGRKADFQKQPRPPGEPGDAA